MKSEAVFNVLKNANMAVKYEAAIKNAQEQEFCDQVVEAIKQSSTLANKICFARKTKSYGSTGVALYRATASRDGRTLEIWVNLGKISGGAKRQHDIDFDLVPKIADYAESDRITAWFKKYQAKSVA